MIVKVNTSIGTASYQFEIDEKSEMEALHKAAVFGNPPKYCGLCQKSNVVLASNKDKDGNTYVNIRCQSCGATAKLGQYKTGGFFWHKFELYVPKESKE